MVAVKDFGAVGDGLHDDTPAFEAFAAAHQWQPLYVPSGTYRLTRPIHLTANGRMTGDGPGLSWLVWDSGDGVIFTSTSDDNELLHISDLTFRTRAASGTALKADFSAQIDPANGHAEGRANTRFLLQNCCFQPGLDIVSSGWDIGFELVAGLIGQVRDCNFFGRAIPTQGWPIPAEGTIGCLFHGTGEDGKGNGHPVQFVVDGCTFGQQVQGVSFVGCEGGFVTHCNLVGVGVGVAFTSIWNHRPHLNVVNTHINSYKAGVIAIDCADLQVSQNLLYNFGTSPFASTGIYCGGSLGCHAPSIIGNTFCGVSQPMNGVVIGDGANGLIANNIFRGHIDSAVWLQEEATEFRGQGNVMVDDPAVSQIVDQGTDNRLSFA